LVVARWQDNWRSLRADLFPATVLLALSDQLLSVQRLPGRCESLPEALLVPIPAATCREGRPLQVEALGDFIGDLILGEGQITAHLSVALPTTITQWRVFDCPWPQWPEDPAAALRALDPDLALPFPLEQAYLDLMPLEAPVPQALVAAIERDLLGAWLEVFAIAGVRVERIVPTQLALMVALQERLLMADPDSLVALLHPEAKALRLLVWRAGVPVYERLLAGGSDQQVAELERCLAFLHRRLSLASTAVSQLWLDGAVEPEDRSRLEALLALPLEPLAADGFGSLVLQGLARLGGRR
jgi:Tfp pilus assembly PilM family ATPase